MNVPAPIRRALTAIAVLASTVACAGCNGGDNPDTTASPTAATTTGTNPSAGDNVGAGRSPGTSGSAALPIGDATADPAERGGDKNAAKSPAPGAGQDRKGQKK